VTETLSTEDVVEWLKIKSHKFPKSAAVKALITEFQNEWILSPESDET
jgi:hypothetical protein